MSTDKIVESKATKDEATSIDNEEIPSINLPDGSLSEKTSGKLKEPIFNYATLFFSLLLVIIGFLQYGTYNKQAEIAINSNILSQYEYRFEFYNKVSDLQKAIAIIPKEPQLGITEFSELSFEILSLIRESELLFDKDVSDSINKILEEHLYLLVNFNNEEISYYDYKEEIIKLNNEYGDFLNSDSFKRYLNINNIK